MYPAPFSSFVNARECALQEEFEEGSVEGSVNVPVFVRARSGAMELNDNFVRAVTEVRCSWVPHAPGQLPEHWKPTAAAPRHADVALFVRTVRPPPCAAHTRSARFHAGVS